MVSETQEQMKSLIEKSSHILLICPPEYNADTLASMLALSKFLQKMNKKHDVVCEFEGFSQKYQFLPGLSLFKNKIEGSSKFLVTLNIADVKVKEFSYDVKDDSLNIYITPEKGRFSSEDVKSHLAGYPYDLIITIDAKNLTGLGKLFEEHVDFFYSTPIINIDDSVDNEHFGQINHVDIAAGSISEILFGYFETNQESFIDAEISTLLLAGIYAKTRGFRHEIVSPKTLRIAATLMEKGADSKLIITSLYQTKSIDVLKAWGKILSRLDVVSGKSIYYSHIDTPDLKNIQINSSDIVDVIHELLVSIPDAHVIVVSYKKGGEGIRHIIWGNKHHNVLKLAQILHPKGTRELCYVDSSQNNVLENQKKVLDVISKNV